METRKMIVGMIMVVFAFVSAADATVLSWSVDSLTLPAFGTAVVWLEADDDQDYPDVKWVGHTPASPANATIVSIAALPAAGDDAIVEDPSQTSHAGWWTVRSQDLGAPFNIASGAQYYVTIKLLSTGTCAFNSDYYGTNDVLTIFPEPATICLLGIGALGLLKKRRA